MLLRSFLTMLPIGKFVMNNFTQEDTKNLKIGESSGKVSEYYKEEARYTLSSYDWLTFDLADIRIQGFFNQLGVFFLHGNFRHEEFNKFAEALKSELSEIASKTRFTSFYPIKLQKKLHHASHTLNVMTSAVPMLRLYDISGSIDAHLVHCMVELNVLILNLYDSYGEPDCQKMGFAYKVYNFLDMLSLWRSEFLKLTYVGSELSDVFDSQYVSARESLDELSQHIE